MEPDFTALMTMDDNKHVNIKDDEKDDEEKMEDNEEESNDPVKSIKAFKTLVIKTLEDNEMDKKRASKMEIMDFLNLLRIFNE
jgi:hypothetical protein